MSAADVQPGAGAGRPGPPLWLLLELTYRCPLHCVFCYNPTDFSTVGHELETAEWLRVRPRLGPVRFALAYLADEAAYGAGVCRGAVRERMITPLLPRLARRPLLRSASPAAGAALWPRLS